MNDPIVCGEQSARFSALLQAEVSARKCGSIIVLATPGSESVPVHVSAAITDADIKEIAPMILATLEEARAEAEARNQVKTQKRGPYNRKPKPWKNKATR